MNAGLAKHFESGHRGLGLGFNPQLQAEANADIGWREVGNEARSFDYRQKVAG